MALCSVLELSRTCSYEVSSQRDMYRESRNCLVLRLRMVPIVVVVAGYVRRGTVVVKFEVRDGVASSSAVLARKFVPRYAKKLGNTRDIKI
jgi:hypothetical protein